MAIKHLSLPALLLCCASMYAAAAFMDGNKLLTGFEGHPLDVAASRAYVMGVVDSAESLKALPGSNGMFYACFDVPNRATAGQLGDVVKVWLQQNPQHRHFNGPSLVANALATAYPCAAKR
ncbi:Rap1a/Tai family immunity protein [Variovorax boronicumulans]|uniref:Rap1a/Tai family immunity protein n=1 Tax=Variovorax boronicumulans TaxID=436515 RepID=UPI00339546D2